MQQQIVEKTQAYITKLLIEELTPDHHYHNLTHTLHVKEACLMLGERLNLSDEDLEILSLAALFHDTGFTKTYDNHEEVSKMIASDFLKKEECSTEKIDLVLGCIEATKMDVIPTTLLQKVITDADFNTLGIDNYQKKAAHLRHEWEVFRAEKVSNKQWQRKNYNFWKNHQFYTQEAEALFGKAKSKNLKKLKKKVKEQKSKKAKNKRNKKKGGNNKIKPVTPPGILAGNRSAQMIFKTTLRNHIDLTSIADNKANIMLSINALIITITIPLLAGNIKDDPSLIFPTAILLLTCLSSMIYATLATRPIKTMGSTDLSKIPDLSTNLFFFGNFYKMNLADYKTGIRQVASDDEILDNSVVMDLFFLGKALGIKFNRLRICYGIFMIGMILTVTAFAVASFLADSST